MCGFIYGLSKEGFNPFGMDGYQEISIPFSSLTAVLKYLYIATAAHLANIFLYKLQHSTLSF
jgi:hypothetical protein